MWWCLRRLEVFAISWCFQQEVRQRKNTNTHTHIHELIGIVHAWFTFLFLLQCCRICKESSGWIQCMRLGNSSTNMQNSKTNVLIQKVCQSLATAFQCLFWRPQRTAIVDFLADVSQVEVPTTFLQCFCSCAANLKRAMRCLLPCRLRVCHGTCEFGNTARKLHQYSFWKVWTCLNIAVPWMLVASWGKTLQLQTLQGELAKNHQQSKLADTDKTTMGL